MANTTSQLYYNGYIHKDIYFDNHYHKAMYRGNELLWEKINRDPEQISRIYFSKSINNKLYGVALIKIGPSMICKCTLVELDYTNKIFKPITSIGGLGNADLRNSEDIKIDRTISKLGANGLFIHEKGLSVFYEFETGKVYDLKQNPISFWYCSNGDTEIHGKYINENIETVTIKINTSLGTVSFLKDGVLIEEKDAPYCGKNGDGQLFQIFSSNSKIYIGLWAYKSGVDYGWYLYSINLNSSYTFSSWQYEYALSNRDIFFYPVSCTVPENEDGIVICATKQRWASSTPRPRTIYIAFFENNGTISATKEIAAGNTTDEDVFFNHFHYYGNATASTRLNYLENSLYSSYCDENNYLLINFNKKPLRIFSNGDYFYVNNKTNTIYYRDQEIDSLGYLKESEFNYWI